MFVDRGGLGFSKADEVDDVREDLHKAVVGRFEEVLEAEIVDPTLFASEKIAYQQFELILSSVEYSLVQEYTRTSVNSFRSEMKKPIRFLVSAGTISPYSPQTSSPAARIAGSTVSRVVFVNNSANHSKTFWTC